MSTAIPIRAMGYVVRMPKLGMEMERGTLVEWTLREGDTVSEGDTVAEIESEKASAAVAAREDGVLRRTYLDEGETVEPGDPIAIVAAADEDIADLEAEAADGSGVQVTPGEDGASTDPAAAQTGQEAPTPESAAVKASPRARRRAEELGVDLAGIDGSGVEGSIKEADVEAAASGSHRADERAGGPATLTVAEERPLDSMRRTIADRLSRSYREAVHVTEHRSADAEQLFAAVDAADAALDVDVSVQDVLLVALSAALDAHPELNARFEDGVHRIYAEQNVGLAVDVDAGLIAPVLADLGGKSLREVATARQELTGRALDGAYSMDDLSNGTFTVTNLGVLGVESFDPVIDPPQVAILGVDAVDERAVQDDGDVAFRRFLPFDLSFDHRVIDGADAARFLATLVENVEDPWPLLPEDVRSAREAAAPDRGAPEMPGRSVTASLDDGLAGTVTAGSFSVPFDEPADIGGTETGPAPVDLFLGALASCLAESIRFQAAEKNDYDLSALAVHASADPDRGPVESVAVAVEIGVDADDETVERLVRFGERGCHVSQLLREDLPLEVGWERS